MSMDEMHRVIRIVFLDFRKAFDLIDHKNFLENMEEMGVRSALIKWFASYLDERSHFTQIGKEESDFEYVNRGIPQESKLGPIAFVVKINMLPLACVAALRGGGGGGGVRTKGEKGEPARNPLFSRIYSFILRTRNMIG